MKGKILLSYISRSEERDLYHLLRPMVETIDFSDDLTDSKMRLANIDYDMIMVDHANLDEAGVKFLQALSTTNPRVRVLVLSEERLQERLGDLFSAGFLTNLIAKSTPLESREIMVTAQKILRNDLFGMEKYLLPGTAQEKHPIAQSSDKNTILAIIGKRGLELGLSNRLVNMARGVADEFVMNAIYNAPVDDRGKRRYTHLSRTEDVVLEPEERATFELGCDGRHLAISVTDPFGSLTVDTLRRFLAKCFARDEHQLGSESGGAGMGFYYIFNSLSQFIVNIEKGKKTEMLGLLDVSGTFRNFAERTKSFNVFIKQ